jgi:4'-phosphopantetheinyl transferase
MNDFATSDGFERMVRDCCAPSGFVVPATGEAGVLVFDSEPWMAWTTAAENLLDADERRRAARFRFDHDRATYTLAHACWRVVLGMCLGVEATAVPLTSLPSGQPVLPGGSLATSLSHSGTWVAIAMARAVTVGVDIERFPSRVDLMSLLTTICTPPEAAQVLRLPDANREAALLTLWVRKEALLKAFGTGLREAPSSLPASNEQPVRSSMASDAPACVAVNLELPANLSGALAMPSGTIACRTRVIASHDPRV